MAVHEIHVKRRPEFGDPRGADVAAEAKRALGINTEVSTTTVYRVEGPNPDQIRILAREAFVDPIVEEGAVNPRRVRAPRNVRKVEVAYLPEVTDPVAGTIKKVGDDLGIHIDAASVSTIYEFEGISRAKAKKITERQLVNKTVQSAVKEKPKTLVVTAERGGVATIPTRYSTEEELMEINKKQKTNMNLPKLKAIQEESRRIGRDFTDAEFHYIDGRWSEHCVHESFDATIIKDGIEKPSFFSRIKESARRNFGEKVATAFDDNAGGIHFYDDQVVLVKWETHNSPSALEPKGGAATGSGGVFRDIMGTGQGAKVILSTDVFMTGPTDMDPSILPPGCIPPDSMLRGVISGVRDYGNPMGIPTANGSVHTHEDFRAKPTILVGAYGITPEKYSHKGEPQVGDRVVAIGGRTGRDGIHGASFSSVGMRADTVVVNSASVQIGNPIEEKKVADFITEARDANFIRAITDCGAAGFASAIGEMAENTGVSIDISNAPVKYEGLAPWELWMSESQERMVLAVSPDNFEAFRQLGERFGVEATDLGFFDGSNRLQVNYGNEKVVDLDYDFIKNGRPKKVLQAKFEREVFPESEFPEPQTPEEWIDSLCKVLAHDNVCSKLPIVEQYDTTVQGTSALAPYGGVDFDAPNDAAIIRPLLDKPYGIIASHGANPILNRIDPRRGAIWAATEAISNLVAAGGDYKDAALCVNYVTPVLDEHFTGAVDMIVDAMTEFQDALGIPVISGKDSVSSTYYNEDGSKLHIPIVLNAATLGKMPDVDKKMTTGFKKTGSTLVLVGKMHPGMGGSVYFDTKNIIGNEVPEVDLGILPKTIKQVHASIPERESLAVHDVSEGGFAVSAFEMSIGGGMGVVLDLPSGMRTDFLFYNETTGMFLAEIESPEKADELFGNVPHMIIGYTTEDKKFTLKRDGQELFSVDDAILKEAYQKTMKTIIH